MFGVLYAIIIFPIVNIIDFVYLVVFRIFKNPGISIMGISLAVSVLTLPLYLIADKHQKIEREIQKILKPKIKKIKAVFKGDEQYMILSTYYRQNSYHPVYAMRKSFSLLIQVPFFIAAYTYLSGLESIQGISFLFINDFGKPDGLLAFGPVQINILPIVMTAINCISSAIYVKIIGGGGIYEKIQLYGIALVFLLLLYNSASCLVLYWLLNNLFSLAKNLLLSTKRRKKLLYGLICTAALSIIIFSLFFHRGYFLKRILLAFSASLVFFIPLIHKLKLTEKILSPVSFRNSLFFEKKTLFISLFTLFILLGVVIPGAIIASSVQEFSFIDNYASPLSFIFITMQQAAGFFLFWPLCIYFLFSLYVKRCLCLLFIMISFIALLNTFVFPGNYGFLTSSLIFSDMNASDFLSSMINIAAITIVIFLLFILIKLNKNIFISYFQYVVLFSLIIISFIYISKIQREYNIVSSHKAVSHNTIEIPKPTYQFSQTGKNVIVIMLDRGISGYVPYIFDEKPELRSSFSGFTYYPNCVSFGGHTIFGLPGLLGGYEYSPLNIQNAPSTFTLSEKYTQALLVLPRLFSENNFHVTVSDLPFIDYRMLDEYPQIHIENVQGKYSDFWSSKHPEITFTQVSAILNNNLIRFSFFKCMPFILREFVYDGGEWLASTMLKFSGNKKRMIDQYAALDLFPDMTAITDIEFNTYTTLINDLTHEPYLLSIPDYRPSAAVSEKGDGPYAQDDHYHVNMAAFLLLGKWLDYLKENDVFDNTRIIIASDHGVIRQGMNFSNSITLPYREKLYYYNCLLMTKDFNASGDIVTDMTFMTNADTPLLAVSELISRPLNPFTNNPIRAEKENGVIITTSHLYMFNKQYKYKFNIKKNQWITVHDNIFEKHNWSAVEKSAN